MRCAQCQHENPEGAKFCNECAAPLPLQCPSCGTANRRGAKFCNECATPLATPPLTASGQRPEANAKPTTGKTPRAGQESVKRQEPRTARRRPVPAKQQAPEAERRQLTVLFCDLVDSTALAAHLDPEELREVIRAYQATSAGVIQRLEGHIAQYLGDGLLVYCGYPQAHEDDAQRAVRTGLGLVEAMEKLNESLQQDKGIKLAVRVGIHTGLVVVGEIGGGGRRERLALGETPNIAARLQGLAEPDTVVISGATQRLVQGVFTDEDLGPRTLKGMATPVQVFRVLGESGTQSRLDAAATRGLTPLVGREQEVGLLLERWAQAKDWMGQVVVLSGEAGIGKSRLVQVVKEHVAGQPHVHWECRCSSYYQHSALYPVIDLMQRALRFERDDGPDAKLIKLEGALGQYGLALPEVVPLLAALLSLPLPDRYPPLTMTPQRQRQKTLEAVLAVLLALAAQQPVLLIVEDLHWIDPSTLELLSLLINQVPTARICALLTCRAEFRPPWPPRAHLSQLMLSRLPRSQAEVMVERITGGRALPPEVHQQVVDKTDGVPLFVEELTKMVLESGLLRERESRYELKGPLPTLAIPTTLQDSLMARLDRLAAVKEVAQLSATLGRGFSYELLKAVAPLDEATLQQALARLQEAELLYQRGVPPQATYLFKHALIQEAAYQSLLRSRRQQYHRQIAQVLEARFPEVCTTQPELLAHHYTQAGLGAQAIPYWQQAGQQALQRSANLEAVSHLTRGLEVLKALPESHERAHQELALHLTLGPALMATKGQTDAEVERVYARARELCQRGGETPQLFTALGGLHRFYFGRGELQTARELGEQFLRLAGRQEDPALQLTGHWLLGTPLVWLGELTAAHTHFEESIALYDPQQHRRLAFHYGLDPGSASQGYMAYTLWELGYPDQALWWSHKALTLAQEVAHPFSMAYVRLLIVLLHSRRREGQAAYDCSEATLALSTEHGFPIWILLGTFMRGYALVMLGQGEGIAQMRQHQEAWRATALGPVFLLLLADAYGTVGQPETGLMVLAEARDARETTGHRLLEAEAYRLQGEFMLAQPDANLWEAETCFRAALDIARHQQAKSWELRAAMSLSRLWQQQGKRDEALELLAPIYGWFTEGFDTADLKEAKALLAELT